MRSMLRWAALMGVGLLITGCAAQPLAPQVEEVVITQTPGSAETPPPRQGLLRCIIRKGPARGMRLTRSPMTCRCFPAQSRLFPP